MKRVASLLFALLLPLAASAASAPIRPRILPAPRSRPRHALATDAGSEVIGKGGNAFDAAVAVSAALSVVEPISSGLGGGGFLLLHDAKSGRDVFVDARETSPASATPDRFLDKDGELDPDRAQNGPWAAGIPGLPATLVHVAGKYGRLPLAQSLAPAIRIARDGFPVYGRMARGYAAKRKVMDRYPGTRAVFLAERQTDRRRATCCANPTWRHLAAPGRAGLRRLLPRRPPRRSWWPASTRRAGSGGWTNWPATG